MKRRNTAWFAAVLLAFPLTAQSPSPRLPNHLPPEIYAWFWQAPEFQPDGYKPFLDRIATKTNFGLLTTSLRIPEREITLRQTHDQIRRAVDYAHSLGLRVAFDLDVRLARSEFLKRHPNQQQWMLRIRRVPAGQRTLTIESLHLGDHMTWPTGQYELISGRFAGAFDSSGRRVEARTVEQSASTVKVEAAEGIWIAAAFEYRTPDVFAPALLDFQESIYAQYRDIPLDGVLKDEWGFPPVYNRGPREGDFWYSEAFANAYRATGGGDLLEACVRMLAANDAQAADRYSRLILTRNTEIEMHFYSTVKRIWGSEAFVGTHATWGIMPTGDAFKNGYDWWSAPRDYGQTDEDWPYPIRTSLAKKWGKPVWFNQYYNSNPEAYAPELWKAVRNGGRINFHPLYPFPKDQDYDAPLLRSPVMRAESRIRLLNYVTQAPVDSPVAVIFSHPAALNWLGPNFGDLGLDFARDLERDGYRTDVIPSSEITSGALRVDQNHVRYGAQRYRAIVLLNTASETSPVRSFIDQAIRSNTVVFGRAATPMPGLYEASSPVRVAAWLDGAHKPYPLQPADLTVLTDGTCILARGSHDPTGDPINETFYCGNRKVRVSATGVFAIRLNASGDIEALAASQLHSLETGPVRLKVEPPVDVAVWRDSKGHRQGVIQNALTAPAGLKDLGIRWTWLASNVP